MPHAKTKQHRDVTGRAEPNIVPGQPHPDDQTAPLYGLRLDIENSAELEPHVHRRGQLLYVEQGLVTLDIDEGSWVAPPGCAVWIPGGARHVARGNGPLRVICVYLEEKLVVRSRVTILSIRPLFRELLQLIAADGGWVADARSPEGRRGAMLLDEIEAAGEEPLFLPMPRDRRARRVADALIAEPACRSTLEQWGRLVGASSRTLTRLFIDGTGLNFTDWRHQLHVGCALEALAQGEAVGNVALNLGYDTPSAFIAMFRRRTGTTPSRYFPVGKVGRARKDERSRSALRRG